MRAVNSFFANISRRTADDHGSAMAAVIGLLAVTMVIGALVAASVVQSLTFTVNSRSAIQAQAAADGGIQAAYARLASATCVQSMTAGEAPYFESQVFTRSTTTGAWAPQCPTSSTVQVKIVSTGYPQGVTPDASGETGVRRSSEAIYSWTPPSSTTTAGGPAVYAFDAAGFGGSGKLVSVNGSDPEIMVKQGNVTCSGGAAMQGDLIVDGGTLTLDGSCGVSGNIWASGAVTLKGNVPVGGNVVAPSLVNTGGKVGGSTWTTGNTTVSWGSVIAGNATASTLTLSGGNIQGRAWASGTATWTSSGATIDGGLTAKAISGTPGTARGGVTIVPSGPGAGTAAPTKPVVPNWVDFASSTADWTGFTVKTISGTCGYDQVSAAVASLGGSKGVIDGRGCTSALSLGSYQKLTLTNDLVIISNSFSLGGSAGFASSAAHKLWLITPDDISNAKPDCPAGSTFKIEGSFVFPSNVSTMLYSPCKITLASGIKVWGQVFAGQAAIAGDATLSYVPIGLPGYDLNTGTPSTGSSNTGTFGALVSYRELAAVN